MIYCKPLLFLSFLIFLPGSLFSQQIISSTLQKTDFIIPYHNNNGKSSIYGNTILREMAKDVLREPWLVRIHISCTIGLTIVRIGDQNQLLISLNRAIMDGDTVYRHFPVNDVLFPSHVSMKLRWANRADTSGYTEESLSGKPILHSDSLLCTVPVTLYDPIVDTLMVREIEFFYDSLALRTFLDRIALIHDYYASVSLLDSLFRFTADLDISARKLLPLHYLKIAELSSVLERIDARDFRGRLLQNGYDPSGLMVKYLQLYKHSRSLIYNFMDELRKAGAIPREGDLEQLAAYFTSRVYSYVRRSYLMDQQQGLIYNDCLDHFFDHGAFPPGENIEPVMLAKLFPGARQDTLFLYVSRLIYGSYQHMARQLMDQNHFAEAYSMMTNGRRLLERNPALKRTVADDPLLSKAAEGIYNSYLGIASTCIRGHQYKMADTYLSRSAQYATAHPEYIHSDSAYRVVFSELFFLRNADCDLLLDQEKYAEALDCYQQFEKNYSARDLALISTQLDEKRSRARIGLSNLTELLSEDALKHEMPDTALYYYEQTKMLRQEFSIREPVDARLDSLAPVMAQIKFEHIYEEGSIALEKRQFSLAVTKLKEAKSLAEDHRIIRGTEFDSIYRRAMKMYLIIQLSVSQKRIWVNQFDSAQASLQRTETAGYNFGLLNDPDFNAAIENFKLKIREQRCRNLKDSVDLRMIKADLNITLRNFVNTLVYLREALAFSRSVPECTFGETAILDSIARYGQAEGYQQILSDARSYVASGNYDEAVRLLDKNQRDFNEHHLNRLGLQPEDIYAFIQQRNNPYLAKSAISYYFNLNDYAEALRFSLLAHELGMPAYQIKEILIQLGSKMAQADYRNSPGGNVNTNIAKYIPEDKWYDAFRISYANEWNRLVREAGNSQR